MPLEAAIATKKARLDALRPLAAASLANLEAWYEVELTFTSNAIEGNTLTRQETALVIEKGLTIGGKPLKDHLEALDHVEALRFVRELAKGDAPVGEREVLRIHALVMARSNPAMAGVYSQFQRRIAGSAVILPSPRKIPGLMEAFGLWLAAAAADYDAAFEAHYRLVGIHPFGDGNGRAARLLMNLLLWRAGYPPVLIGPAERRDYIGAIETAQLGGSREPYRRFMLQRLDASLGDYLSHLDNGA